MNIANAIRTLSDNAKAVLQDDMEDEGMSSEEAERLLTEVENSLQSLANTLDTAV